MQEEVENRTLTLVVSGTKFTGRLLKAAVTKYMAHLKEKKLQKQKSRDAPVIPHGKQTVKELIGQNQGVSNIEITDPSIKEFEKIARKYGVDYAVKKDRSCSPPKYLDRSKIEEQKKAVRAGYEGLLFYGSTILPFVDHFPKDTELYRIMTTKLSDMSDNFVY